MRVVVFCHSLLSDWNHGSAHFLRGVTTELSGRGHDVRVFEPREAWSVENLVADHGEAALGGVRSVYPGLSPVRYAAGQLDLDRALDDAALVLVHEWNDHDLVARIGAHRRRAGSRYRLLFHDTHHRAVSDERAMAAYDLSGYDGVLAFGAALRDVYARRGWARRAFVWHEAADVRVFRPRFAAEPEGDVVWVGNWGDGERTAELSEMLFEPIRDLGLRARVHGFPLDWNHWQIDEWPDKLAEICAVTDKPLWVTEVGVSTFGAEEVQDFGLQRSAEVLLGRATRIHWYSLYDLPRAWPATTRHREAEGSSYYRHFYMGLLDEDGAPKRAAARFPEYAPELGICQWFHFEDHRLDDAVRWLERLGVEKLRTGLSWADSHRPGADQWFDRLMRALERFDVTVTFCFTPGSAGLRDDHTSPPRRVEEFAEFCVRMVRRYT